MTFTAPYASIDGASELDDTITPEERATLCAQRDALWPYPTTPPRWFAVYDHRDGYWYARCMTGAAPDGFENVWCQSGVEADHVSDELTTRFTDPQSDPIPDREALSHHIRTIRTHVGTSRALAGQFRLTGDRSWLTLADDQAHEAVTRLGLLLIGLRV